jgi:hypothetical protein
MIISNSQQSIVKRSTKMTNPTKLEKITVPTTIAYKNKSKSRNTYGYLT